MLSFVPPHLPDGAPLVVVLHGCLQTAQAYDEGSGWSMLAKRHGFALVYAEQAAGQQPEPLFQLVSAPRCPAGLRGGAVDPPDGHPHAAEPQH